jgi:DNA invertase Pin-like site-specific DNA recombinase
LRFTWLRSTDCLKLKRSEHPYAGFLFHCSPTPKLAILDHACQKHCAVDRFVEVQASSRKGRGQRRIDEVLDSLTAGDRLVVSELSRLGRSLGQVIQIVDELVKRKIHFTAIKER